MSNQTEPHLRLTVREIQCHPWITDTCLPKYIDHKLAENKVWLHHKKSALTINKAYKRVRKVSEDAMEFETESKLMLALSKNPENSFLVGVKISHAEEMEKLGVEKYGHRSQGPEARRVVSKEVNYSFPILKQWFENPEKREVFERTFERYVIQDLSMHMQCPWKIGFTFSAGLRSLVTKFVRAANKLKIKISVVDPTEFRFRCVIIDSLGGPSDRMFTVQIFDFIGEYVFDVKNETVPKIPFLVMCKSLYSIGSRSRSLVEC